MRTAFLTFWSRTLTLLQIAHANFTVVFLLIQLQPLLEMQIREHITSSAPDDIFQETPTQVVENGQEKSKQNRLTDSCALLPNIRLNIRLILV